jgi:hypothetical protein
MKRQMVNKASYFKILFYIINSNSKSMDQINGKRNIHGFYNKNHEYLLKVILI